MLLPDFGMAVPSPPPITVQAAASPSTLQASPSVFQASPSAFTSSSPETNQELQHALHEAFVRHQSSHAPPQHLNNQHINGNP
eukprot:2574774-Rhodomonas_salina.1